jgi:hypothetical protein
MILVLSPLVCPSKSTCIDNTDASKGAIDGGVVDDAASIEWHRVVPFSPFGTETNTSRYLQWAIEITGIFVCSAFLRLVSIKLTSAFSGQWNARGTTADLPSPDRRSITCVI